MENSKTNHETARGFAEALRLTWERLNALGSDLGSRALSYVETGEGAGILGDLAKSEAINQSGVLHVDWGSEAPAHVEQQAVYRSCHQFEPEQLLRFAYVVAAPYHYLHLPLGDKRWAWVEVFLAKATGAVRSGRSLVAANANSVPADLIEGLITRSGGHGSLLLEGALVAADRYGTGRSWLVEFSALAGAADCALWHRRLLDAALDSKELADRVQALRLIQLAKVPPAEFADAIFDFAVSPVKATKQVAVELLAQLPDARGRLEQLALAGGAKQRAEAAALLHQLYREQVAEFLCERAGEEKDSNVLSVLRSIVVVPDEVPDDRTEFVPIPVPDPLAPLPPETLAALEKAFDAIRDQMKHDRDFPTPETVREATAWLQDYVLQEEHLRQEATWRSLAVQKLAFLTFQPQTWQPLLRFLERTELRPIHCVRLAFLVGQLDPRRGHESFGWQAAFLFGAYLRSHPEVGFRELAAAFLAVGLSPKIIGWERLRADCYRAICYALPSDRVWPYYAEHPDLLEKALTEAASSRAHELRANAFRVLALFPTPPSALLHHLWSAALGKKSERALAQAAAERTPDRLSRLVEALESRKAETRGAAAEWLGRLGEKSATESLAKALARETDDATKGLLLGALTLLGESVERFIGPAPLAKDAAKGLAKGIPKEAAWFPFGHLPVVHWEKSGKRVESESLRWLVVQAVGGKNPEPGTVLRRNAAAFRQADREALGQFVLTAWLAEDTSTIPLAEAEQKSRESARAGFQWQQQFAQYAKSQNLPVGAPGAAFVIKTEEQLYQEALAVFSRQPKGSAIGSKGVLAVAAACCGPAAVAVVGRYLKDWYGQRAAQCRALVQVLAWMEHPTAIQLMLAVGGRFRTKSIQEEAAKQAQALAERKGWTLDELADRTVPSAGFDEAGELRLHYGPRQFVARLGADFAVTLFNPDGKEISALPEPRQDDDATLAAQAKKSLSSAKKELKTVLQLQRDRLYEAMCTQREWRFEDWELFLNRHPILRHYCARLVWSSPQADGSQRLFRPLPDGSLTDADDEPVTLVAEDRVGLTHGSRLTPEGTAKWIAHLADYSVEPVFSQFAAMAFALPSGREADTELADFQGHTLGAFRLRGRATKLGYVRGATQDGGWFYDYRKRFVAQGLEVVIEFTGNALPEDDRPVALRVLAFERLPAGGAGQGFRMPLGEVPAVLLCESWNDVRALAAEGTGFDPEWEKKCQS